VLLKHVANRQCVDLGWPLKLSEADFLDSMNSILAFLQIGSSAKNKYIGRILNKKSQTGNITISNNFQIPKLVCIASKAKIISITSFTG